MTNVLTAASPLLTGHLAVKGSLQAIGLSILFISQPETPNTPPVGELRLMVEQDTLSGEKHLGLSCPNKSALSLWSGSDEEIRDIRQRYRAAFLFHKPAVNVKRLGEHECDWLDSLGYQSIESQLAENTGLLTFFYEYSGGLSPIAAANLGKLRAKAKALGFHVLIFFVGKDKFDPASIKGMVDKLIVFEPCEADPNWQWAISAEHRSQGHFSTVRGKMMCQLSSVQHAFPKVCFDSFLASDLASRLQWHLHKSGTTMQEIGVLFDTDKGTVSRHLAKLPKLPKSWLSDEEIEQLANQYLGNSPRKSKTSVTSETGEDEDEFDLDDDDDLLIDLPKAKKRPRQ